MPHHRTENKTHIPIVDKIKGLLLLMPSPNLVAEVPVQFACGGKLPLTMYIFVLKRTIDCDTFLCESQPQKRTTRFVQRFSENIFGTFCRTIANPKRWHVDFEILQRITQILRWITNARLWVPYWVRALPS